MLFQIVGERLAYGLLYGAGDFRVAQFGLRLTFKLRLGYLDADDGCQSLAEVFAGNLDLGLLDLLRDLRVGIGVFLQCARQCHAESDEMRTAFDGVDVVNVGVNVLRVVGVVHHCHFDGHALLLGLQVDDVVEQVGAVAIDVANELLEAFLGVENFFLQLALFVGTHVAQRDGDAGVQVGQLAHTLGNDVVFVLRGGEDAAVRPELLARTGDVSVANDLHVVQRFALLVLLLVDVTVAEHLREHVGGERIHAAHTDAVQTTADLVGAFVELTTGVQHGHDDFQSRLVHLFVLIDGNTAAVVLYGNGVVFVDSDFDMRAIARHRLVNRVVNSFVYQMVETLFADVSDVHGRAFAHSFQSFEHLNVTRGIVVFLYLFVCHFLQIRNNVAKLRKKREINECLFAKKAQKIRSQTECGMRPCMYAWKADYPSLLMCCERLDLMLAALFLWIMLRLASLSSIFCTLG